MRTPARILVVDDVAENVDIVRMRLEAQGYEVKTARDGEEALVAARLHIPDLILLDVMMPKRDGISVLKELKADESVGFIPIILLTAKSDRSDIVAGLDAGGDDYLTKPFDQAALLARVRSMLRIKTLHDTVQDQAQELARWNHELETRVAAQVGEIERMGRLKRFLAPQIADIIAAGEDHESLLDSHRREVTAMFCDLRGFTAFTEIAKPEEVMTVLDEYHHAVGAFIDLYEGTLERFAGDGLVIIFNDPLPCVNHTERAVRMALDMRDRFEELTEIWRERGHDVSFGIGIALGMATLGRIGFERRRDYAAVGSVTNLASRLCDEAKPGQILLDPRAYEAVAPLFQADRQPPLALKGFRQPVEPYSVVRRR